MLACSMRKIDFSAEFSRPITQFNSEQAHALGLGHGKGEMHLYCLYFGERGESHSKGSETSMMAIMLQISELLSVPEKQVSTNA